MKQRMKRRGVHKPRNSTAERPIPTDPISRIAAARSHHPRAPKPVGAAAFPLMKIPRFQVTVQDLPSPPHPRTAGGARFDCDEGFGVWIRRRLGGELGFRMTLLSFENRPRRGKLRIRAHLLPSASGAVLESVETRK